MIAEEPQTELALLARQLEQLNQIGAALAAERDTARLLDLILAKAREITSSDAGSLYLVEAVDSPAPSPQPPVPSPPVGDDIEPPRALRFAIAQDGEKTPRHLIAKVVRIAAQIDLHIGRRRNPNRSSVVAG